jgi:hypothetical protein
MNSRLQPEPAGITAVRMPRLYFTSIVLIGLGLLTISVLQLSWVIASLTFVRELQYGESQVYSHVARIIDGEPLYQPIDREPYTAVAYMPLYYWLAAGARVVFGPGFGPGRTISALAGALALVAVGYLAGRQARSRWAGVFAALLFLSLGYAWVFPRADLFYPGQPLRTAWENLVADLALSPPWLAFYRPDVLGVTLSLTSVAALFGGRSRHSVLTAAVLAGLAILSKQTFLAAPLAGFIWLWRRDRTEAIVFGGVVLAIALSACVALQLNGGAFLSNVVAGNANPMRLEVLAATLPLLLRFQVGPMLLAGMYALRRWRGRQDTEELLIYYWITSALPLLGLTKTGANHNYWIEFAASSSVLATLWLWTLLRPEPPRRTVALAGIALLCATLASVVFIVVGADRLQGSQPAPPHPPASEFQDLLDRVRATPGDVISSRLEVLVLADRPILFDGYTYMLFQTQGLWDSTTFVRKICDGHISLLVFAEPLEQEVSSYHGYPSWPPEVLRALREAMVFESQTAGMYLYVPRAPGQSVCAPIGSG